jgi:hypothetical protein
VKKIGDSIAELMGWGNRPSKKEGPGVQPIADQAMTIQEY